MNFASDNTAGVRRPDHGGDPPAPMTAMRSATAMTRPPGGSRSGCCELFEREVAAFLVPTGTVANSLALAHVSPPWGAVLCHAESHINDDESGAPEFFGGGLKLIEIRGRRRQDHAGCPQGQARARPRRAAQRAPVGPVADAIDRTRHRLPLDEIAALADIAHAPWPQGAHGRRALCQCAACARRFAGGDRPGRPASTCSRSAPPRAARSRPKRSSSSIRRSPPGCRRGASAAAR